MLKQLTCESAEWVNSVWEKIDKKLSHVSVRSRNKLPYTASDGVHDNKFATDPGWWTNGFWGGMMWLMYINTKNEDYRLTAEKSEEMLDEVFKNFDRFDHDAGFIWHLTAGADYRITGNKKSYNRNMFAASALASRYNPDGQYIRAWNSEDAVTISIIDCMMNLSLLYWASEVTKDSRFKRVAMHHADMTLKQHIRADGSIYHMVAHDENCGDVTAVYGGQGYDENSCWSRGLSWAVYGMAISYAHTGEERYLNAAKKCADYFIEKSSKTGYLPQIDFCAPKGKEEYYDSTAGACAASGMLKISEYLSGEEKEKYLVAAVNILRAIDERCACYDIDSDYLIGMGSERYPFSDEDMKGVHIPIIYADFFFTEAICRLKGNDFFIW